MNRQKKKVERQKPNNAVFDFEAQLSASARRLRNDRDGQLIVAKHSYASQANDTDVKHRSASLPRRHPRLSWGWYATPAAAMIGLLIGFSIPRPTEQQQTASPIITLAADTTTAPIGHSLAEDNTDYSLFVRL